MDSGPMGGGPTRPPHISSRERVHPNYRSLAGGLPRKRPASKIHQGLGQASDRAVTLQAVAAIEMN